MYAGLFGNRLSVYYTAVALSEMSGIAYPLPPFRPGRGEGLLQVVETGFLFHDLFRCTPPSQLTLHRAG